MLCDCIVTYISLLLKYHIFSDLFNFSSLFFQFCWQNRVYILQQLVHSLCNSKWQEIWLLPISFKEITNWKNKQISQQGSFKIYIFFAFFLFCLKDWVIKTQVERVGSSTNNSFIKICCNINLRRRQRDLF